MGLTVRNLIHHLYRLSVNETLFFIPHLQGGNPELPLHSERVLGSSAVYNFPTDWRSFAEIELPVNAAPR